MTEVLLKRDLRTPHGRFDKSVNGVPTNIPQNVIDKYGLPKDAVIVDEDYQTPEELSKTESLDDHDTGRTSAREEAKALEKAKAAEDEAAAIKKAAEDEAAAIKKAAEDEAAAIKKAAEDEAAGGDGKSDEDELELDAAEILKGSVKDIVAQLPDFSADEIEVLLDTESESEKSRNSLIVEFEAALEDRAE